MLQCNQGVHFKLQTEEHVYRRGLKKITVWYIIFSNMASLDYSSGGKKRREWLGNI